MSHEGETESVEKTPYLLNLAVGLDMAYAELTEVKQSLLEAQCEVERLTAERKGILGQFERSKAAYELGLRDPRAVQENYAELVEVKTRAARLEEACDRRFHENVRQRQELHAETAARLALEQRVRDLTAKLKAAARKPRVKPAPKAPVPRVKVRSVVGPEDEFMRTVMVR